MAQRDPVDRFGLTRIERLLLEATISGKLLRDVCSQENYSESVASTYLARLRARHECRSTAELVARLALAGAFPDIAKIAIPA